MIKVLVVDDHKLVRESIKAMLTKEPDIEVIGTAADGRAAIDAATSLRPDVIVMDVSMPGLDGIRAAREIRSRKNPVEIVMLSMHHSSTLLQQARKSGAAAYIIKQQAIRELIPAVRAAYAGEHSL